jgi:hypothetical protein
MSETADLSSDNAKNTSYYPPSSRATSSAYSIAASSDDVIVISDSDDDETKKRQQSVVNRELKGGLKECEGMSRAIKREIFPPSFPWLAVL